MKLYASEPTPPIDVLEYIHPTPRWNSYGFKARTVRNVDGTMGTDSVPLANYLTPRVISMKKSNLNWIRGSGQGHTWDNYKSYVIDF